MKKSVLAIRPVLLQLLEKTFQFWSELLEHQVAVGEKNTVPFKSQYSENKKMKRISLGKYSDHGGESEDKEDFPLAQHREACLKEVSEDKLSHSSCGRAGVWEAELPDLAVQGYAQQSREVWFACFARWLHCHPPTLTFCCCFKKYQLLVSPL